MENKGTARRRSTLYPIGLKLEGRRCLVVGTGSMARKKIDELLDCGASVHVVAPEHEFDPSDLDGVHLVVSATDNSRIQDEVFRAASARAIPRWPRLAACPPDRDTVPRRSPAVASRRIDTRSSAGQGRVRIGRAFR